MERNGILYNCLNLKKSKRQTVRGKSRWNKSPGCKMLIEEVLRPLLEIIYLYKESNYYNYVPGTEEDSDAGWKYFEKRFRDIYCGLNQNLYISQEVYLKVHKIIEEIQTFVRMFSGADGLSERYFEINPNLLFYRCPFDLKEEDEKAYEIARQNGLLGYVPSEEDFTRRKRYFSVKNEWSDRNNFYYDREDFFMQELAYTLRLVFLKELSALK
ncbi:hypothetical protein D5278_04515 [bacterium 1XD21-13]|nr:hypothetical protein [bacterium 1XD21-13]